MKLYCALVWHMHQPLYLDPVSGRFAMPWVRLHSVKAYNDMLSCLKGRREARVTFNFVPSLLYQIGLYLEGKTDEFLEISRKKTSELSNPEKEFILTHFFSCHWPTMVEPYQRYVQLLALRGRDFVPSDASWTRNRFSEQDLLDLQVWFNLTWMGFAARKDPFINGLFQKGRLFTEEEKARLLDAQLDIMKELIQSYAERWTDDQIEITTSPFYHPILPLLMDTDYAKRCAPGVRLPRRFSYPQDATAQLKRGKDFCQKIFKKAPSGLWPSEGSVAPELIPAASEAGFSWLATDEAILYKSIDSPGPDALFQPYKAQIGDSSMDIIFRHHELSDLIGFVYKENDPEIAAVDFITRLNEIRRRLSATTDRPPFVAVILDGENPWEYYMDGGEGFLSALYDGIICNPDLELVTVSDYLKRYPPNKTLTRLHTGSWINGDFGIWIGGEEENRAWEVLGEARTAVEDAIKTGILGENEISNAMESIFAAEGSDWFWWYGDKFSTSYAYEFDSLFRLHLQGAYRALRRAAPADLSIPLRRPKAILPAATPVAFITPIIDGRISFYWEWNGAGSVSLAEQGGSMHRSASNLNRIFYGFNINSLFLRLDPAKKNFLEWPAGLGISLSITTAKDRVAIEAYPAQVGMDKLGTTTWRCQIKKNDLEIPLHESGIRFAIEEIAEFEIPFVFLNLIAGEELSLNIKTIQDGLVQDTWTRAGYLSIKMPDKDFERRLWLV
ncbi:glycoside hydrolase family 57 protein [Dissulfurimicrobium hydrothermale]|uniref:glycoside hydrolase family 57 protein n=1 Tax=Dissulfurimicrobium hydrothermale TaxID=1750598 RepID=UPI001EDA02F2|nr:glycoside hydrolase family 57 protein [Dissulfurimicrobium hydrothermale]UKL14484.1 hypothetical protein LGS26_04440 [Dissulfurimicrobium hydrothermale]